MGEMGEIFPDLIPEKIFFTFFFIFFLDTAENIYYNRTESDATIRTETRKTADLIRKTDSETNHEKRN